MHAFKNTVGLHGRLQIQKIEAATGRVVQNVDIRNMIMNNAADVLLLLIGQRVADGDPTNQQIYSLRVGGTATAPTRTDLNLVNPIYYGDETIIGDAGKVVMLPGEMKFLMTMGTTQGNTHTYNEAGLFTKGSGATVVAPGPLLTDPKMFARQVFPNIAKTNAFSLVFAWTLSFTS